MKRLEAFLEGLWEFVVGDDWVTAAGVVLALGITALIADSVSAWWVLPAAVPLILGLSLWRATRSRPPTTSRH